MSMAISKPQVCKNDRDARYVRCAALRTAHLMLMPRIGAEHFERWLELWRETVAELLPQPAAAKFMGKAELMAERLLATIDQYHTHLANQGGAELAAQAG